MLLLYSSRLNKPKCLENTDHNKHHKFVHVNWQRRPSDPSRLPLLSWPAIYCQTTTGNTCAAKAGQGSRSMTNMPPRGVIATSYNEQKQQHQPFCAFCTASHKPERGDKAGPDSPLLKVKSQLGVYLAWQAVEEAVIRILISSSEKRGIQACHLRAIPAN